MDVVKNVLMNSLNNVMNIEQSVEIESKLYGLAAPKTMQLHIWAKCKHSIGFAKLPLKRGHEWVIASKIMGVLLIHALIAVKESIEI